MDVLLESVRQVEYKWRIHDVSYESREKVNGWPMRGAFVDDTK
ncbi:hypothetical protein HanXRQr2_Chr11g0504091 [Helianthus annuus]|uniref:Uncharacterized protein n=1 Tax=Helianthus annuus TaxID=4232 RepID=A0A9K3N121_HELAN|nr:hypothetical protein HanXRQr2_Chr11g0504091 [Helianthus annuus]